MVTGVSAGALLAPLAFLGPQWDAEMTAIYTGDATHDLLQRHVLAGLFGSSVYSGAPLRRLIERYADERLIAAVAAQSARGRLLLVATTEFATGEPVIWDLSSVALQRRPRRRTTVPFDPAGLGQRAGDVPARVDPGPYSGRPA